MFGLIDSGVGGLTVLRRLRARFPHAPVTYFADQANAPLGVRSAGELSGLFRRYVAYLESIGVETLVMGSNTLCAVAHAHGWPASALPIVDIIDPTVQAVAATGKRRVAVLATAATARSQSFGNAIRRVLPDARVQELAASEWVDLVERDEQHGPSADAVVARTCAALDPETELIVLGCTHFPWLEAAIARNVGPARTLLDPAEAMLDQMGDRAGASQSATETALGTTTYLTTANPGDFRVRIERLLGPLPRGDRVLRVAGFPLG